MKYLIKMKASINKGESSLEKFILNPLYGAKIDEILKLSIHQSSVVDNNWLLYYLRNKWIADLLQKYINYLKWNIYYNVYIAKTNFCFYSDSISSVTFSKNLNTA